MRMGTVVAPVMRRYSFPKMPSTPLIPEYVTSIPLYVFVCMCMCICVCMCVWESVCVACVSQTLYVPVVSAIASLPPTAPRLQSSSLHQDTIASPSGYRDVPTVLES
jgi:hypothetical protein